MSGRSTALGAGSLPSADNRVNFLQEVWPSCYFTMKYLYLLSRVSLTPTKLSPVMSDRSRALGAGSLPSTDNRVNFLQEVWLSSYCKMKYLYLLSRVSFIPTKLSPVMSGRSRALGAGSLPSADNRESTSFKRSDLVAIVKWNTSTSYLEFHLYLPSYPPSCQTDQGPWVLAHSQVLTTE